DRQQNYDDDSDAKNLALIIRPSVLLNGRRGCGLLLGSQPGLPLLRRLCLTINFLLEGLLVCETLPFSLGDLLCLPLQLLSQLGSVEITDLGLMVVSLG